MVGQPNVPRAPEDFYELTPGDVFLFRRGGESPLFLVWDPPAGVLVSEKQSIDLLHLTHEERLSRVRSGGQGGITTRTTIEFGPGSESEMNRDFSRVRVLTTDDLEGEPDDDTVIDDVSELTLEGVESLMPIDFEAMQPGTVFTFDHPGADLGYYIWNGVEGMKIDKTQAEQLASVGLEQRLTMAQNARGDTVHVFGKKATSDINKDFSRVTILAV